MYMFTHIDCFHDRMHTHASFKAAPGYAFRRIIPADKVKAYLKTAKTLRQKAPWCNDPEIQRGAKYLEDFVHGAQTIEPRMPMNVLKPRALHEILGSDFALPNFNSSEWKDFASSFTQALAVHDRPPRRRPVAAPERNVDGFLVYTSSNISGLSALETTDD